MRPACNWNSACGLNSDGFCTFGGDCRWSSSKLEESAPSTDVQQLKQAIALVRKHALTFASTSLYNTLDSALVMVEQHARI